MLNALTIDVEEYFQVSGFEGIVRVEDWPSYESRVERNTYRILSLLAEKGIHATFFILGWIAERHPRLVRHIHEAEHEIACHGYGHRLIYRYSRDDFRNDIRRAKLILEDCIGSQVTGYRAPSYSITTDTMWALDILVDEGFEYDSSIFPIRHDRYGIPDFERFPTIIKRDGGRAIKEFPITTIELSGTNFPVGGGGYFRLFPYRFTRWALNRINTQDAKPFIFYFHPWEIDPRQPRLHPGLLSRFRHYVNLSTTEPKLRKLFDDFRFTTAKSVLDNELSS